MFVIIDYRMGNLGSVKNMLKKIGVDSIVTSDKKDIEQATKLLLPGVGSFDHAMRNLKELDLIELLKSKVLKDKVPILGICLGMQLLTKGSEEGELEGFGFIDAYASKFDFKDIEGTFPIPHMGWNESILVKKSKLIENPPRGKNRFYFVHSYAIECQDTEDILSKTDYGYEFVSSFERENVLGCQFHPEKSHQFGLQLFKNFVENY